MKNWNSNKLKCQAQAGFSNLFELIWRNWIFDNFNFKKISKFVNFVCKFSSFLPFRLVHKKVKTSLNANLKQSVRWHCCCSYHVSSQLIRYKMRQYIPNKAPVRRFSSYIATKKRAFFRIHRVQKITLEEVNKTFTLL